MQLILYLAVGEAKDDRYCQALKAVETECQVVIRLRKPTIAKKVSKKDGEGVSLENFVTKVLKHGKIYELNLGPIHDKEVMQSVKWKKQYGGT